MNRKHILQAIFSIALIGSTGTAASAPVVYTQRPEFNAGVKTLSAGIAASLAVCPAAIAPGKRSAVALNAGHYNNRSAVGLTVSHIVGNQLIFSGGIATSAIPHSTAARASVSFSF